MIEAKESSNGRTYLYEYDDSGRLSTVILPTGERMLLTTDMNSNGVLVSVVNEGNGGSVDIELNDNQMSVIRGEARVVILAVHVILGLVCSCSLVATNSDYESGCPDSSPEWVPIGYKARSLHRAYLSLHSSGVAHRY